MASLKEQLRTDLTAAMKARDSVRAGTLRMALTAVTNAEVAGENARELSDDEVLDVLTKEAKQRRESTEAFEEAGRAELASKERTEGEIIAEYLPQPLTEDQLAEEVRSAVAEAGATSLKEMGSVMKIAQARVKGRAEGAQVAAEVRRQLS